MSTGRLTNSNRIDLPSSAERLQHLLSDADWNPLALDEARVRQLVALNPPEGILVLDDTAFPKKGTRSVGVQLVDRAQEWEVPFRFVVTDAGHGDKPTFLAGLEERQIPYVCAVERNFGLRLPAEVREGRP
jgi:SRSO17 transposase